MLREKELERLRQLAGGIAAQFGSSCEVAICEVSEKSIYPTIVAIENGYVTGRKIGDSLSRVLPEPLNSNPDNTADRLCYLTRTPDGKVLKSSMIYIHDDTGGICAIFEINFDISAMAMAEDMLRNFMTAEEASIRRPEQEVRNVADLLDDLICQADALVGKPVALMSKEDKVKAIRFLNSSGAMLITKSGDKIARHFRISKYTLYSYLGKL